MSAETVTVPDWVGSNHLSFGFDDDHEWYVTAHRWTTTASNAGTITAPARVAGGVLLTSSDATAADNDEIYMLTTREMFLVAATKPLYAKSLIQYAEVATDDANVFVGFCDAIAADTIVDDGGMKTTASAIVLHKKDGETEWRFLTSVGTTQTDTLSQTTAGGAANQKVELFVFPHTSTTLLATAKVDDAVLKDTNGNDIQHTITLGTPTEMQFGYGVKAGSATSQTASVYKSSAWQKR